MRLVPRLGRIDYDMVGIGSLVARDEFRVPIYQRSYAWPGEAVEEFFYDLQLALDEGAPDYFLGTIVLTPSKEDRRTVVIDGQQRLATTSILLAVIRDLWGDRGEDERAD